MQHNTYLEDYLENISTLPMDLTRKFQLMHDLDKRTLDIVKQVETETRVFVQALRRGGDRGTAAAAAAAAASSASRSRGGSSGAAGAAGSAGSSGDPSQQRILADLRECVTLGDEKVALAAQTYEMVDKHIRRLDEDLVAFARDLAAEQAGPGGEDEAALAMRARSLISDTTARVKREREDMRHTSRLSKVERGEKAARKKHKANARAAVAGGVGGVTAASAFDPRLQQLAGVHGGEVHAGLDLEIDPNEPTYCTCNRVSFGSMIACDNSSCSIEWFHLDCIGLTAPPKGKWFCTKCSVLKRQGKI